MSSIALGVTASEICAIIAEKEEDDFAKLTPTPVSHASLYAATRLWTVIL
jgi:hypothetical protein